LPRLRLHPRGYNAPVLPRASWLTLAVAFSACGGAEQGNTDAGFVPCTQSQALQTLTSQSGAYTFYICDAAAPARGFNTFSYLVVDKNAEPVDGLTLSLRQRQSAVQHRLTGH
jgi:hypothetical protein